MSTATGSALFSWLLLTSSCTQLATSTRVRVSVAPPRSVTTTRTTTAAPTAGGPAHTSNTFTFAGNGGCVGLGAIWLAEDTVVEYDQNFAVCPDVAAHQINQKVQNLSWLDVGDGSCMEIFQVREEGGKGKARKDYGVSLRHLRCIDESAAPTCTSSLHRLIADVRACLP